MVTGAAGAVNRPPVLLLPSDYFANRIPDPVLQQISTRGSRRLGVRRVPAGVPVLRLVSRPEQLLSSLPEAFRVTDPAETGAVTISLPEDVQSEAFDWPGSFLAPGLARPRPPPEPRAIAEAADLIRVASGR
jgi:3D-(3,5/4)-trihydroxycyclohexane-1,2-dione acylhydrolase (decyclizing)